MILSEDIETLRSTAQQVAEPSNLIQGKQHMLNAIAAVIGEYLIGHMLNATAILLRIVSIVNASAISFYCLELLILNC